MKPRVVEPELLDLLPPEHPDAVRSRADLRRVNRWMRNELHLAGAIQKLPQFPSSILEIGAGDGTFMLRVAQRLHSPHHRVQLHLLDMEPVVAPSTPSQFAALGWDATVVRAELRDWLAHPMPQRVDLIVANLFLHHFRDGQLQIILQAISALCNDFIACEPRRWPPSLIGTRLLWCIGCNHVTRHDAQVSVRAGFRERELSELWPAGSQFELTEQPAGLATHLFTARRNLEKSP